MSDIEPVIDVQPEVDDRVLVALTPADMAPAQHELLVWCDRKLDAVKAEVSDIEANLQLATEKGWKHAKCCVGAEPRHKAGGVLAVRVKREKPPKKVYGDRWGGFRAHPELLPAGEGRYVDDALMYRDESAVGVVDGKEKLIKRFVIDDYDTVDFPVRIVKPAILDATQRAMALKVFDQMGVVQNNAGRDPIVVGHLLDPRGNRRCVTFFVAWWLNTQDL